MFIFNKKISFSFENPRKKAILLGILGGFFFVCAVSFSRKVSPQVSSWTLVFFRSIFSLLFFLPFFWKNRALLQNPSQKKFHLIRVLLANVSIACTYYTYRNIPMATSACVGYTGPLFTCILALFLLKERLFWYQWLAVFLGYLGVFLVFEPEVNSSFVLLVALVGNLCASLSIITTKKLSSTESRWTLLFFSSVTAFFLSGFFALFSWTPPTSADLVYMVLLAVFVSISNLCYISALKEGEASLLASLGYVRLIFALFMGMLFFQEIPSQVTWIGGLVIVFSTYIATKKRKETLPVQKIDSI